MLPIEVSELAVKVSAEKQNEVQTVLAQIFTGTDSWEKQVDEIEVKGIDDKMSIQLADVARKNAKQARISAEKIFDAKREEVQAKKSEYDLEDKLWLKAKQVMQLKFKAIEEKAEYKANFVKRHEAEQKELKTQARIAQVALYADINRIEFENMSDDVFETFLGSLKEKKEAEEELIRQAEEARIAKEKADAEERERMRLENERLKAEREEMERKATEERDKAEAERKRVEEENRKEREAQEARLKAEREEKQRIEAELKAKQDAERKAQEEADRLAQEELSKGDKEKFLDMIASLEKAKEFSFKSKKHQAIHASVCELVDKTIAYAKSKA